ncbi:hypothetical protein CPB85DRAFT_1251063 [Mucidula mucida]|nr:hypothetical protein CPB85DRAFT_1251063 [Mucidula mucida]
MVLHNMEDTKSPTRPNGLTTPTSKTRPKPSASSPQAQNPTEAANIHSHDLRPLHGRSTRRVREHRRLPRRHISRHPDPPMSSYTTFGDTISAQTAEMILMLVFPHVLPHMLPPSRSYSLKTLAAGGIDGEKLPLHPSAEQWSKAEATMGDIAKWIGDDRTFVSGEKPSFADFAIAASIRPIRLVWGVESKEWKAVTSWQDGKWGRLMKALECYKTVQ